jgi:hypothetical protein
VPGGASRAERDDAAAVGSLSRDRGLTYRHSLRRWDPILSRCRHIQTEIFSSSTRPLSLHLNAWQGRYLPTHEFFAAAFHGWQPICHPSRSSIPASAPSPYPRTSTDTPIAVFPLIGSLCHRYEVSVTSRCCIGGPAGLRPDAVPPSRSPSAFGELPDQFRHQYANLLPAGQVFSASRNPDIGDSNALAAAARPVWPSDTQPNDPCARSAPKDWRVHCLSGRHGRCAPSRRRNRSISRILRILRRAGRRAVRAISPKPQAAWHVEKSWLLSHQLLSQP